MHFVMDTVSCMPTTYVPPFFFFFPNTLLYMSGHHSVDTAIWIRQANKTARWRLSEAEQGWGFPDQDDHTKSAKRASDP